MSTRCQGERGCPNDGEVELTATGNVGDSDEVETIRALVCLECAKKALLMAADKIG